ncbi:GGDEF domain-containing protein [Candidatus Enterococcus willemsii]|uniref:GGDEF domain-containing protein n=1 Tax=Candidatus Enterococcus willemsii TaxID=1857215 RepID=A0ABQ6Z134_9ENTE|nr:GGDEF domain-containing protein [Enterococcus sp. CU12B]KAF1305074.1 hypothetical protein BAU17_04675 [Enterococcus sp. CU12B]
MVEHIRQFINPYNFATSRVTEIQKEYTKIDENWLAIQLKVGAYLSLMTFFIELLLSVYISQTVLVTTTLPLYFLKYLIIPSTLNFLLLLLGFWMNKYSNMSQQKRMYGISVIITCICFILTTAHNIFIPIYAVYLISIVLTGVYAKPNLTKIIGILSISLFFISEFIIKWDPNTPDFFTNPMRRIGIILLFILILIFTILCVIGMYFLQKKYIASINLEIEHQRLEYQLQFDELTGIYNRLGLNVALKAVEEESESNDYILAMVDVDHFKQINDRFGHPMGDQCLKDISNILKMNEDEYLSFRFGGDEFCLLFQDVTMEQAVMVCRKIQQEVQSLAYSEYPDLQLTASFGLSEYRSEVGITELFIRSDYALYKAKKIRNHIRVFDT